MSVTHKRSEKQIGAAELEALRASIMAEVEAARAETEESIISSIRNNLVSIPEAKSGTRRKAISRATW